MSNIRQAGMTRPKTLIRLAERIGAQVARAETQIRLRQRGTLRTGSAGRWMKFQARQSIDIDQPAFRWTARVGPLGLLQVRDELQNGLPGGSVSLLGGITLSKATPSPALLKGELMRYLAELPWAPDALLSNERVIWAEDANKALQASVHDFGVRASVLFRLNAYDAIASVSAEDRPRQEGRGFRERPWHGTFDDYRTVSGRLLPHKAEVSWDIDGTRFPVWRGALEEWEVGAAS